MASAQAVIAHSAKCVTNSRCPAFHIRSRAKWKSVHDLFDAFRIFLNSPKRSDEGLTIGSQFISQTWGRLNFIEGAHNFSEDCLAFVTFDRITHAGTRAYSPLPQSARFLPCRPHSTAGFRLIRCKHHKKQKPCFTNRASAIPFFVWCKTKPTLWRHRSGSCSPYLCR
jgi:hypothetical protein